MFESSSKHFKAPTLQETFLISPPLGFAAGTWLHFRFWLAGVRPGTLAMEYYLAGDWIELWSMMGNQGADWELGTIAIPRTAALLRFVGSAIWSDDGEMKLDAVGVGAVVVAFETLSCNFEISTCSWLEGNFSWRRVSAGMSHIVENGGDWHLQAARGDSEGEEFTLESPPFTITAEMVLRFAYHVNGSGAVLELQHMTRSSNWATLFVTSSSHEFSWQTVDVKVPVASTALRFLARTSGSQDVISIDSVTVGGRPDSLSCSFEEGLCGWEGDAATVYGMSWGVQLVGHVTTWAGNQVGPHRGNWFVIFNTATVSQGNFGGGPALEAGKGGFRHTSCIRMVESSGAQEIAGKNLPCRNLFAPVLLMFF